MRRFLLRDAFSELSSSKKRSEIDLYHTKISEGFEILSLENESVKILESQFSFKLLRELTAATMRFTM